MRELERYFAIAGLGLLILGIIIETVLILLQTNPSSNDAILISTTIGIWFISMLFFNVTYWEWKHQPKFRLAIFLISLGIIGFMLITSFWSALIQMFYPKSYIRLFMIIDFASIAFGGCFQLILGRSWSVR